MVGEDALVVGDGIIVHRDDSARWDGPLLVGDSYIGAGARKAL